MADNEEWEMIPHKILSDLKDEVQGLKEKLDQPSLRSDMISTILELKASLKQLQGVIQTAIDTVGKEENDPILGELQAKMINLEQQNTQIAQALVTIADLVENMNRKMEGSAMMPPPRAAPPQLRPLPPRQPQRMAPPPPLAPRPMPRRPPMGMPPPPPPPFEANELPFGMPPPPPEKSGLFGKLLKK